MSWPVSSLTQTTETTLPSNFGSLAFIVCLRSNNLPQPQTPRGGAPTKTNEPRISLCREKHWSGGCWLQGAGSAISFVVSDSRELRLGWYKLLPPLHRRHHLHGLIPHLVGLTRWITVNQITNANKVKKYQIPFVIPVVVLRLSAAPFSVCQRRATIGCAKMDNAFLAETSLPW
jgi:hypothetical protein